MDPGNPLLEDRGLLDQTRILTTRSPRQEFVHLIVLYLLQQLICMVPPHRPSTPRSAALQPDAQPTNQPSHNRRTEPYHLNPTTSASTFIPLNDKTNTTAITITRHFTIPIYLYLSHLSGHAPNRKRRNWMFAISHFRKRTCVQNVGAATGHFHGMRQQDRPSSRAGAGGKRFLRLQQRRPQGDLPTTADLVIVRSSATEDTNVDRLRSCINLQFGRLRIGIIPVHPETDSVHKRLERLLKVHLKAIFSSDHRQRSEIHKTARRIVNTALMAEHTRLCRSRPMRVACGTDLMRTPAAISPHACKEGVQKGPLDIIKTPPIARRKIK